MTGTTNEDVQGQGLVDNDPQGLAHNELPEGETAHVDKNEDYQMPSAEEEEKVLKKKYGGIIPKKKPLISKDHERAFFDSADWALGKQGAQKPKNPLEALRPKLQPTQQHARSRRSAYAPADGEEIPSTMSSSTEDHDCSGDEEKTNNVAPEDPMQSDHN